MVPRKQDIEIELDDETQSYYIFWKAVVICSGKTEQEALENLRTAAHSGVDTLIDLKLEDSRKRYVP